MGLLDLLEYSWIIIGAVALIYLVSRKTGRGD